MCDFLRRWDPEGTYYDLFCHVCQGLAYWQLHNIGWHHASKHMLQWPAMNSVRGSIVLFITLGFWCATHAEHSLSPGFVVLVGYKLLLQSKVSRDKCWGQCCGVTGEVSALGAGMPCRCRFVSWMIHLCSRSLLMVWEISREWLKFLDLCTHVGDLGETPDQLTSGYCGHVGSKSVDGGPFCVFL